MRTLHHVGSSHGFTLLEALVASGILLILTGFAVFPLIGYKNTEEFNTQEKIIVAFLRDAQQRAITREQDYRWGVRFTNSDLGADTYELFFGDDPTGQMFGSGCGTDNNLSIVPVEKRALKSSSDFDPASLPVGCSKDIVFNPGTGTPNYSGEFINSITIVPKGFSIPPKTIIVEDNGKITS